MKRTIWIILFMLVGAVYADQIPSLKTWVASESYKAADMNANFAKIRSIVNGLLREDNFPSGFTIPASWVVHLTWPSHGSSHAAAGTDPLATDTTYLVGNIAATNATFTNVTAAQVTGTQMTATGITATNATFTTVAATNVNVSGTITGGNVSAIHGTFSGDLSAAGNATFSKGIVVTGADDSGYSITVPYPGLNRFGGSVNAEAGNFSSLSATSALYITGNATFTASASLAAAHVASLSANNAAFYSANIATLSANNAAFYSANIATLSASQVQVSSLTTESRLTVGGNLYMSGGGNLLMDSGYMDMAGGIITNVATPSAAVQAANKGYVDSISPDLHYEASYYVASIGWSPINVLYDYTATGSSIEYLATYTYTNLRTSSATVNASVNFITLCSASAVDSGHNSYFYLEVDGGYDAQTGASVSSVECLDVTMSTKTGTIESSDNMRLSGTCIVPPSSVATFSLRVDSYRASTVPGTLVLAYIVPRTGFKVMSW